jgi:DNA invertase Pin-like site-specific DNA recombinase
MKPKAYLYIRMSTERQLQGDSFRRQNERAIEYCRVNDLELVTDFPLIDVGFSAFTGAHIMQGALGKFLKAIEEHRIDRGSYLIIESHDRLSRMPLLECVPVFLNI